VVILDAALLIESGNYRKVDKVVVVACSEKEQVRRILEKGVFGKAEIRHRLASQMPLAEKIKVADFVIQNDSTLERLEGQVEFLFQNLKSLVGAGA